MRARISAALSLSLVTAFSRPAFGLQPVTEFVAHARTWDPQNRAARATASQRSAEVGITEGNLLPSLSATGTYTRNQYEVTTASLLGGTPAPAASSIPSLVIQPQNQLDANATLTVPLVDVGSWERRAASKQALEGAREDERNTQITVEKTVVRDYYTLLGEEAVLLSATKTREVAQGNVKLARDKREGGTAAELDVQRALADQAKAEQSVTAAQLNVYNTRQDLFSLSGVRAEPATTFPEDDLHEEGPLEAWTGHVGSAPSVRSAAANRVASEDNARAITAAVIPTVTATAEEKLTNATAFLAGHSAVYLLQIAATWRLDATLFARLRQQDAMVAGARAEEDRARQAAEDAVFRDWQQIRADIESARSARAQVAAAQLASSLAEDRYTVGIATQLDLLQSRQEAFSADVARIQADSDLAYARAALRLDAGQLAQEQR